MKLMNNPVRINKQLKFVVDSSINLNPRKNIPIKEKIGITETAKTFLIGNNYIE